MDAGKTGTYLAALRHERGMTQQDAAELLHLSNKTVSKWESGGGLPDITVLPALAELYGVTADDILAGETLKQGAASQPTAAERRKYLLQKARLRFDIFALFSLVLALLTSVVILPYVCDAAEILCPALLLTGWLLFRPTLMECPPEESIRQLTAALRETLVILFIWEFQFRSLAEAGFLLNGGFLDSIPAQWPAAYTFVAAATYVVLQFILRKKAGKGASLLPGWLLVLISTALVEYCVGWARYLATFFRLSSSFRRLGPTTARFAIVTAPYNIAMGCIGVIGVLLAVVLFLCARKKKAALQAPQ